MPRRARTATLGPAVIEVTLTGTTANRTYTVKAVNRRTKEHRTIIVPSDNRVPINVDDLSDNGLDGGAKSGFNADDVIELSVKGYGFGDGTTFTASKTSPGGRVSIAVTDNSTTNTPAVTV